MRRSTTDVRTYDELGGARGRAVFFRPPRRRARELWSRESEPTLMVDGSGHRVHDVSINGLSFLAQQDGWRPSQMVEVVLRLHGEPVYAGNARVVRVEPARGGVRVGIALAGGFLDLSELLERDEEACLARDLVAPERVVALVPPDYLGVLSRAAHFVQHCRRSLEHHEARYRAQDPAPHEKLAALARRAVEALSEPWNRIDRAASRAMVALRETPEILQAAKKVTETTLTEALLEVPVLARAYQKPLGYPGDYRVMVHCYDDAFEGKTVLGRVFHKILNEHPLARGARARKDFIVDSIGTEWDRHVSSGSDRRFDVMSLGCGPAREVTDFLKRRRLGAGEIRFTLVDQEPEALDLSYLSAQRAAQSDDNASFRCLNLSFAALFQEPSLVKLFEPQDFIYSTGLFDYLLEPQAQALIEALYDRLRPGGLLAVGNALGPNGWSWTPELLLDWHLIYRTREEMRKLAGNLDVAVEVTEEPTGAFHFVLVRKATQAESASRP